MPFDDIHPTATFSGQELTVTFNGRAVKADYGVSGSPVWTEVVDIEVQSLKILGIDVDINALPDALQKAIMDISDDLEFEQ